MKVTSEIGLGNSATARRSLLALRSQLLTFLTPRLGDSAVKSL
jgi:hypothetical protein